MKYNFRKALSLVCVLIMLCSSMSITAFAEDNDYTVTIYLQEVQRDSSDAILSTTPLNNEASISVTVESGKTLKYAIQKACTSGTAISNDVWDTDYPIYLESLTVGDVPYTNDYEIEEDTPSTGWSTYEGQSWMFFYGTTTPTYTADYPSGTDNTLGTKTVTSDITITLSFEHTTFSWQN